MTPNNNIPADYQCVFTNGSHNFTQTQLLLTFTVNSNSPVATLSLFR